MEEGRNSSPMGTNTVDSIRTESLMDTVGTHGPIWINTKGIFFRVRERGKAR
jgi:hypothetical protein